MIFFSSSLLSLSSSNLFLSSSFLFSSSSLNLSNSLWFIIISFSSSFLLMASFLALLSINNIFLLDFNISNKDNFSSSDKSEVYPPYSSFTKRKALITAPIVCKINIPSSLAYRSEKLFHKD